MLVLLRGGSLWDRLKLTSKDGKHIKIEWILALSMAIFIHPVEKTFDNIIDYAIEYLKDGSYIHNLKEEKERLQLEKDIRELRQDSIEHAQTSVQNKLKRKVSNFYVAAQKDLRIAQIGFSSSAGNPDRGEVNIPRHSFDKFIIKDYLEDETFRQNVRIDIIAPVLLRRKNKWSGIYNGDTIYFTMTDIEFKKSVVEGEVVFTGGTYIICDLNICTAVNQEGETKVSGFEVVAVHDIGIDENPPSETKSERIRKQKAATYNAPSLFDLSKEPL
ncbi:MAG: hypothetical protein LIP09_16670 [Bacteroidales bacterium]|nr:hypothetical protein [Bacteroidales bacterium]